MPRTISRQLHPGQNGERAREIFFNLNWETLFECFRGFNSSRYGVLQIRHNLGEGLFEAATFRVISCVFVDRSLFWWAMTHEFTRNTFSSSQGLLRCS